MKIGDRVRLDCPLSTFHDWEGVIINAWPGPDGPACYWLVQLGYFPRWCNENDLRLLKSSPEEQELQRRQEHAMKYL